MNKTFSSDFGKVVSLYRYIFPTNPRHYFEARELWESTNISGDAYQ